MIARRSDLSRLEDVVDSSKGPVLTDEYAGLLPLDGRSIYLQPFEVSQLPRAGKWNQRPFVEAIRRKDLGAILIFEPPGAFWLVRDRWTPQMLQAVETNYESTEKHALDVRLPAEAGSPTS